jgi:hypothetical protein
MSTLFSRRRTSRRADLPFWRQRGWQLSAAFLALALLSGLLTLALSGGTNDMGTGEMMAKETMTAPRSTCHTEGGDTEQPTSAPHNVKWVKIGITTVPTTPTAGPAEIDGPVWACFAHTPLGAVVAAHCILGHMSGGDWLPVAADQLVPGPGRDAFVAIRSVIPDADTPGHQAATYVGFAVSSYSPQAATVQLLLRQPQGSYVSTSISEQWTDGDWKVVPRSDGSLHTPLDDTVNSTAGFIVWGA